MDWLDSATSYLNNHDCLNPDFDLFSSDALYDNANGQNMPTERTYHRPTMMATSNEYKRLSTQVAMTDNRDWSRLNMAAVQNDEDPWTGIQYQVTNNGPDICSDAMKTVPQGKPKALPTDSGYGTLYSSSYDTDRPYDVEANQDGIYDSGLMYCELCYKDIETKRFFNNNADKKKHMYTHSRPYKCDVMGCSNNKGFASTHDLARHKKSCHSLLTTKTSKFYYRCAAPSCRKKDKVWPRKDNFKAHLEGTHKYDAEKVVELLRISECMPDSSMLPSRPNSPRKSKRRKIESMPEAHLHFEDRIASAAPGVVNESSDTHGLEGVGALFDGFARGLSPDDMMLLDSPHYTFGGDARSLAGDTPRIVVTQQSETHSCQQPRSSIGSVVMLHEGDTPADCTNSPFIMIHPCSPTVKTGVGMPSYSTSEADIESLLESDLNDFFTDTEFEDETLDHGSAFLPLMPTAVRQLLSAYLIFRQHTNGNPSRPSSSDQGSSFGSQIQDNPSGNGPSRQSSTRKRGRKADNNEDDGNERRPKRKSAAGRTDDEQMPLACPFNKHNPYQYGKCYNFILNGISRVKQHLERIHSIPIHCPKCYATFAKDTTALNQHLRLDACTSLPERTVPGISDAKMSLLKRRSVGPTVQDSWYAIYELLFPGAPKPDSPFINSCLSAELSQFRNFCHGYGGDVVTSVIQQNTPFLIYTHAELNEFIQQVHQQVLQRLFLQHQQMNSNPPRSSNDTSVSPSRRIDVDVAVLEPLTQQPTPPSNRGFELHHVVPGTISLTTEEEEVVRVVAQQDMDWVDGAQEQHHFMSHETFDGHGFDDDTQDEFANMGVWTGY